MVRPQAEAITIDKRNIVLECECTGAVGKPDRIRDRDQLRIAQLKTVSGTQQIVDRSVAGEAIAISRVLRLNHGRGGVPATVP